MGGEHGPYRQSERREVYKQYVDELVARGLAYPCFCTDEELEAMKRDAEAKGLPPIYRGRWARASAEEVSDMMAQVRHGRSSYQCCYDSSLPVTGGEPAAAGLHMSDLC